jgi:glycosyltransferase involved in cell wall biosynthesis
MRNRIGLVTPWYGDEAVGGAESLVRELATRLARTHEVTILTTTSRAFLSEWDESYFAAGVTRENGYTVNRFRVDQRKKALFDAVNSALLELPIERWDELRLRSEETAAFIDESINSRELELYLREHASNKHDAVIFAPYLYGVIVRGIEHYPGRAHLLPCLHDEAYARLPRIQGAIHRAATLLMNSAGEAELALRLYGPGVLQKMTVIGSGIDFPETTTNGALPPGLPSEMFLYVGRRDITKNVDMLVDAYHDYRKAVARPAALVLAGPGDGSYDDRARGVYDLGFIHAELKHTLYQSAIALLQPSTNESYSRVIMEAWLERKPVVVHGACLATSMAVERAGGGDVAHDKAGFTRAMTRLQKLSAGERSDLGAAGESYAREFADWSHVLTRLERAIGAAEPSENIGAKRIDQFVQTLEYGDAISDYAQRIRHRLRQLGYASDIYSEGIGPKVLNEAIPFESALLKKAAGLIYHHSIASAATETVINLPVKKALVYHNITPPEFFEGYDPTFAGLLSRGREQTAEILPKFDRLIADSEFNAEELRNMSDQPVSTIPVIVDFRRFDVLPDPTVMARNFHGISILFVGRVSPSKGLLSLVDAFESYVCFNPDARLNIVGRYNPADRYFKKLSNTIIERRLEKNISLIGTVTEAELCAYYRTADLFITLSEHEGFCVPLVEAMYFNIPILALGATAIPETLGPGGLMVDNVTEPLEIGALIHQIFADRDLRVKILQAQQQRRVFFEPDIAERRLDSFVREFIG